ncbi:unnamed protein product [Alopecurus aequalis]
MGKFKRGSLNPPAHPPVAVDPPPASCLIDRVAYIANVTNASTAWCNTTDNTDNHGVTIQVTFVVGDPPHVSYLCAHCIGSQFAYEPFLVATEGRLALLAIDIGWACSGRGSKHYIYYAGDASRGIDPSLNRLPDPDPVPQSPHRFYDGYHLGLLMRPQTPRRRRRMSPLSSLGSSAKRNHQQPELQQGAGGGFEFNTNKAISMCFVDLEQGIIQCDVLDGTPGLRYYPMPPPLEPSPVMVHSYPQCSRDVAIIDGGRRIKCVQLHLDFTTDWEDSNWGDRTVPSYHGWKAATWSMYTADPSSGWRQDSEVVHASEIGSTIDPALLQLPPDEFDGDQGPLTFETLYTSLPVISLHDDGKDVVYFMTKVQSYHRAGLVIAVDMSNKTAQQVTQFLPGKFSERAIVHSRISKHLQVASS